MQLMHKVGFAFSVAGFAVVGTDTGSGSLNLIRVVIFVLFFSQVFPQIIDLDRKINAFVYDFNFSYVMFKYQIDKQPCKSATSVRRFLPSAAGISVGIQIVPHLRCNSESHPRKQSSALARKFDTTTAFSTNNYYFNRKHRRLGMLRTTFPK
jgi:hypothetical protein